MKQKYFLIFGIIAIIGVVLISGCVKQIKKPQPPTFQSTQTEFTNKEIVDAVCSNYTVPNEFFKEVLERVERDSVIEQNSVIYYQNSNYTVLLKRGERVSVIERNWVSYYEKFNKFNGTRLFYCTNDFDEAKQIIEEEMRDKDIRGDTPRDKIVIETTENEKLFEFKIIFPDYYESISHKVYKERTYYRVFKCSYIEDLKNDPDIFGLYGPGLYEEISNRISENYVGKFAQRPVTTENVKELIELLWYRGFDHRTVLSSFTEDQGSSIKHTIYEAIRSRLREDIYMPMPGQRRAKEPTICNTRIIDGKRDSFDCVDSIILFKSEYIVDKNSGEIAFSREVIKIIRC